MKKFGRKTTLNLRYGSDKGSHSVVSDWKVYDFMEIVEKKETNADRIRNMSDEELAEYLPCPHMVNWKKGNYDACVHPNGKDGCKKCMLN